MQPISHHPPSLTPTLEFTLIMLTTSHGFYQTPLLTPLPVAIQTRRISSLLVATSEQTGDRASICQFSQTRSTVSPHRPSLCAPSFLVQMSGLPTVSVLTRMENIYTSQFQRSRVLLGQARIAQVRHRYTVTSSTWTANSSISSSLPFLGAV